MRRRRRRQRSHEQGEFAMSKRSIAAVAAGLMILGTGPASAWMRGGYTPGGGHWGSAGSDGHWAGDWNGHTGGGSYGTTANGTHYATTDRGGSATASDGSWSSQSASGRTNSGTYGTTAYGTHYATGSYGGTVATNNGNWAAGRNGQYAYGNTYTGAGGYGYHPPAVVNQYYGTGCYNCGGWGSGAAVAAGAVAGAAVGVAAGASVASNAYAAGYAAGSVYAALPAGCIYTPVGAQTYYQCNGIWFTPSYGANGTYYSVVPAP
jgi:hypothetical protein